MTHVTDTKPWYKYPWVWVLIAIPIISIILSFSMLWTAISHKDAEVDDDWYKKGKAVTQDFARDDYASALTLSANFSIEANNAIISMVSPYNLDQNTLPATLTLAFSHPTDAKRDLTLTLQKQADGRYIGALNQSLSGRYYLTLSSAVWRLKDSVFLPLATPLTIQPEPIKS